MDDANAPVDAPRPARYHSVRHHKDNAAAAPPEVPSKNSSVHRSRSRYHQKSQPVASETAPKPHLSDDQNKTNPGPTGEMSNSLEARRTLRKDGTADRHGLDAVEKTRSNKPDVRFNQAPQIIYARREGDIGPKDDVISHHDHQSGCFGGLFRKKRFDPIKNVPEKAAAAPRITQTTAKEPTNIDSGGRGIAGNDAPVSAVNAGDRRVLVDCNTSSMFFPVTPETTAMDLISSAANVFAQSVDMRDSVLLEYFSSVGVQRPLRRFERVREVMNSWEDDNANSLQIVPSRLADVNPTTLSASSVLQTQPVETSFLMQYSQKPGSWDKCRITIKQDGQLIMTKDGRNKEPTTVCHLSDFDIYTPTAKQMSKKINPPKRYCYAIKSQQKASMFMSTSTFVHFFCHGDQVHAQRFYDSIHAWRSWYLINIKGEGKKQSSSSTVPQRAISKRASDPDRAQRVTGSPLVSPYQLGSFKPLTVDMSQFDRPNSSRSDDAVFSQQRQPQMSQNPSRSLSSRHRAYPPPTLPNKNLPVADNEPLIKLAANRRGSFDVANRDEVPPFADGGLLGRTYSKHRSENQEGLEKPTLDGSGVIGIARQVSIKRAGSKRIQNAGPRRPSTGEDAVRPTTRDGSAELGRSGSDNVHRSASRRRSPTKPLIDLTPRYQPPPQHMKKGRGYKPGAEELRGGVLIDAATSGEKGWRDEIPESKDWRGRAGGVGEVHQEKHSNRRGQRPATAGATDPHAPPPPGAHKGARVNDARNLGQAQAPLVDLREPSSFANGSLLNRLEKENPKPKPVIDRS